MGEWIKQFDEVSGFDYYYNDVTWEVSWELPIEQTAKYEREEVSVSNSKDMDSSQDIYLNDPGEWSVEFDESSNSYYYYNHKSGETSWEDPTANDENEANEQSESYYKFYYYDESGELQYDYDSDPAYWVSAIDESSGYPYYYNTATQSTQWEIPSCYVNDPLNPIDESNLGWDNATQSYYTNDEYNSTSNQINKKAESTVKISKRHSIADPIDIINRSEHTVKQQGADLGKIIKCNALTLFNLIFFLVCSYKQK